MVERIFAPCIEAVIQKGQVRDPKTLLQEILQARWRVIPSYHVLGSKGPDHAKEFTVAVYVGDKLWGQGTGKSKQEAEEEAAGEPETDHGGPNLPHFHFS